MAADRVFVIVFVLVLAAEADETRQRVTFLIFCLVGIAIALALLTVWYWFYTDPRRRRSTAPARSPLIDPAEIPAADGQATGTEAASSGPGGSEATERTEDDGDPGNGEATDDVLGPVLARQTWDFVAAAKRAESDGPTPRRSAQPAAPRIAVPDRAASATPGQDDADELAVVRRRREQEAARGLSDEVWKSVRQSVFDKLED